MLKKARNSFRHSVNLICFWLKVFSSGYCYSCLIVWHANCLSVSSVKTGTQLTEARRFAMSGSHCGPQWSACPGLLAGDYSRGRIDFDCWTCTRLPSYAPVDIVPLVKWYGATQCCELSCSADSMSYPFNHGLQWAHCPPSHPVSAWGGGTVKFCGIRYPARCHAQAAFCPSIDTGTAHSELREPGITLWHKYKAQLIGDLPASGSSNSRTQPWPPLLRHSRLPLYPRLND